MNDTQEDQNNVQIVSKLTVKTDADPLKVKEAPNGRLWICDLMGRGIQLKQGVDKRTSNIWTAVIGKFEAYYPETKRTYQSGRLFLPQGVQEVIETAIAKLPPDDPLASIDFAFRIFVVRATTPIGYTFEAQPLIDLNANDGLNELRRLTAKRRAREAELKIDPTKSLEAPAQNNRPPIQTEPAAAPIQTEPAAAPIQTEPAAATESHSEPVPDSQPSPHSKRRNTR